MNCSAGAHPVTRLIVCAAMWISILPSNSQAAAPPSCPRASGHHLNFPDGSIAMRTPLAVNPDGAAASYVPGDHGYTYIANGVNLREHGTKVSCSGANGSRCRTAWVKAEAGAFGS